GEDALIGKEVDLGAALLGRACLLQLSGGLALGIGLLPSQPIAPDLEIQLFAERVYAGNAYAVQPARNFIAGSVELSAGMQLCHHDLRGRNFLAVDIHGVDGNTTAVINDSYRVVDMDGSFDPVRVSGECLVNGVIHDFVNQMMQSQLTRGADVH